MSNSECLKKIGYEHILEWIEQDPNIEQEYLDLYKDYCEYLDMCERTEQEHIYYEEIAEYKLAYGSQFGL